MAKNISEKVEEYLKPIVENLGYSILNVEYAKKPNGMNLTITIDSPNGVDLDACVMVHKAIDAPLDELDPTLGEPYTLNVSSPGLDRPIKNDGEIKANIGEVLEAHLFSKINGTKTVVGRLLEFNDDSIILEINIKQKLTKVEIKRENISKLTKFIEV